MFNSNHQCVSNTTFHFANGRSFQDRYEIATARGRCNPWEILFKIQNKCKSETDGITSIKWDFYHSINGGPFYHLVSEENACTLEYKLFSHNEWIKLPEEGAAIAGYPVKNLYY